MAKKALITGITGQDGAYLARLLLEKGYEVYGMRRRTSTPNFWRLLSLGIYDKVKLVDGDMTDQGTLFYVLRDIMPHEVYHLAAQSYVGLSFNMPLQTGEVDGIGTLRLLDAARLCCPNTRIYIASTSELYGNSVGPSGYQDEQTPMMPVSPYASAKLYAYFISTQYRSAYNMFISNGILFNHESPLRGLEFVTRRVTNAVAKIKMGQAESITLGNLDACRDWGDAQEYVDAMWLVMRHDTPDDFVIATGESHSVRELAQVACAQAGLDWEKVVIVDRNRFRPIDVVYLRGDASKARQVLGWSPKTTFSTLVREMVDADVRRWRDSLAGRWFPWDVPNSGL